MPGAFNRDLLLFSCGGDVLRKYGTATRRLTIPTRGGEVWKETVARGGVARAYISQDGILRYAGNNIWRPSWYDTDGDGVVDRLGLLCGADATNWLLQSQALGTTWATSLLTATNNNATAPDGTATATKLVPTAVNSNGHHVTQSVVITSGEYLSAAIMVKPTGYTGVVFRVADNVSTNGFQVSYDLAGGAVGTLHGGFGTGALSSYAMVKMANGWFLLLAWGKIAGGVTAASTFLYVYDTIANANTQTAYTGDAASGIWAWGAQLERQGTAVGQTGQPCAAYIPTTVAAQAAVGDTITLPFPRAAGPLWVYASYLNLGIDQKDGGGGARLLQIGNVFQNGWLLVDVGSAAQCYHEPAGWASVSQIAGPAAYGQIVEVGGYLDPTGRARCFRSIAGGADVDGGFGGGHTAAFPNFTNWNPPTLQLGHQTSAADFALLSLKIGLGVESGLIASLADMRAVPV